MAEKSNVPYDTMSRTSVSSQSIFSKCCFCVPLRTGCFILGYLNLAINVIQTLAVVALTAFIGLSTHGFDHIDTVRTDTSSSNTADDKPILIQIGFLLIVVLIVNAAWLVINIACLVGLHKKRPGPIRVYVGFACARFVIGLAAFIYLVMNGSLESQHILSHSIGLGLNAYFIFVYYIYAVRLEKEREAELVNSAPPSNVFIYPAKLEKGHLVA